MTEIAKIREIFKSIQGEGPYVGSLHVFIRFCSCNLKCNYCDTDFNPSKSLDYTPQSLLKKVESLNLPYPAVLSLTGGEPLMSVDFLSEFLPLAHQKGHKIYLETNATLPDKLLSVLDYIDIVSADIKLESATGMKIDKSVTERFFALAEDKDIFAKIVFDENIRDDEIEFAVLLAEKYHFELILQPKMNNDKMSVTTKFCEKIFDKFYSKYPNVRLIPQVHKFLDVR